jgi:hypothetical protein
VDTPFHSDPYDEPYSQQDYVFLYDEGFGSQADQVDNYADNIVVNNGGAFEA